MSSSDGTTYKDPRVETDGSGIRIRWYYLWGRKRIPFTAIRSMDRFELSLFRNKYRIWGSGDLHHCANLDPGRPGKEVGFELHTGRW